MLRLLPENGLFDQVPVRNNLEKVRRLCQGISVVSVAKNESYGLALYTRKNESGRHEAGIVYIINFPQYCPLEILRFLSKGKHDCFDYAQKYFADLVAEGNLAYY